MLKIWERNIHFRKYEADILLPVLPLDSTPNLGRYERRRRPVGNLEMQETDDEFPEFAFCFI